MVSHKSKSSTLLRIFVLRYVNVTNLAILFEQVLEILIGGAVGQIVNFQRNHPASVWRRASSVARHFWSRTIYYLEKNDKIHTDSGRNRLSVAFISNMTIFASNSDWGWEYYFKRK